MLTKELWSADRDKYSIRTSALQDERAPCTITIIKTVHAKPTRSDARYFEIVPRYAVNKSMVIGSFGILGLKSFQWGIPISRHSLVASNYELIEQCSKAFLEASTTLWLRKSFLSLCILEHSVSHSR